MPTSAAMDRKPAHDSRADSQIHVQDRRLRARNRTGLQSAAAEAGRIQRRSARSRVAVGFDGEVSQREKCRLHAHRGRRLRLRRAVVHRNDRRDESLRLRDRLACHRAQPGYHRLPARLRGVAEAGWHPGAGSPRQAILLRHLAAVSTSGAALQAFQERRTRHTPGIIFEHIASFAQRDGASGWPVGDRRPLDIPRTLADAKGHFDAAVASTAYIDIHAWCFTPSSFRLLVRDFNELGLLGLKEQAFRTTEWFEFFVLLSRNGGRLPGEPARSPEGHRGGTRGGNRRSHAGPECRAGRQVRSGRRPSAGHPGEPLMAPDAAAARPCGPCQARPRTG